MSDIFVEGVSTISNTFVTKVASGVRVNNSGRKCKCTYRYFPSYTFERRKVA